MSRPGKPAGGTVKSSSPNGQNVSADLKLHKRFRSNNQNFLKYLSRVRVQFEVIQQFMSTVFSSRCPENFAS